MRLSRRTLLKTAALPLLCPRGIAAAPKRRKLPVAGVITSYTNNSHADVILGKILNGYDQQGGLGPDLELVSLYTDQVPNGDLSRSLAKKHGFRLAETIDEAITLGTDKVQVACVLSIGEHGSYPFTPDTHQHMYPRRRFFDSIADTFRLCGQVSPLFNDKHLGYAWKDARQMFDVARQMKIPFMAGSSIPVAWRRPAETIPIGCQIEAVVAVGYGGLEAYGFHALEGLQCMVERRRGGESGVAAVQAVQGEAIWQAEKQQRWSRPLLLAALEAAGNAPKKKLEESLQDKAAFYLIDYRDGLRATVAMANGPARNFSIALKLRGRREPVAIHFNLQDGKPFGHFGYLVQAIQEMAHTRKSPYPVARTLLTTGVLDRAMHSLADGGKRLATPELAINYQGVDWPFAKTDNYGPVR